MVAYPLTTAHAGAVGVYAQISDAQPHHGGTPGCVHPEFVRPGTALPAGPFIASVFEQVTCRAGRLVAARQRHLRRLRPGKMAEASSVDMSARSEHGLMQQPVAA
jgi:hypothetical protein